MARKAVAKKEDQLPAYIKQGEGRGNENVESEDVQIPRISVLQALSPQIKKSDPAYIDGAEQGTIFNVLTGELHTDGIKFIPVYFEKDHLVWKTRKSGGGLVARCANAQEAEGLASTDETYEYVPSPNHVCILLKDGEPDCEVSIPMATSKQKVSRRLNSLIRLNQGDRFSRVYHLIAVEDESPSGEYWNFAVENEGFPSESGYLAAEKLYDSISSGTKKVSTDYSDDLAKDGKAKDGDEAEKEY
jgi:hypothetical protein